jgi:hypothetical protein
MATEQYDDTIEQYRQHTIDALESLDSTETEVKSDTSVATQPTDAGSGVDDRTDEQTDDETDDTAEAPLDAEPGETPTGTERTTSSAESLGSETNSDEDSLAEFNDNV